MLVDIYGDDDCQFQGCLLINIYDDDDNFEGACSDTVV